MKILNKKKLFPLLTGLMLSTLAASHTADAKPFRWQWILTGWEDLQEPDDYLDELDTKLNVLDVDFETDGDLIRAYTDKGIEVICYMSVGTYELWRDDLPKKGRMITAPLNSGVPYSVDDVLGLYDDEFFIDIGAFKLDKNRPSGYKMSYQKHKKKDVNGLKRIMKNRIKIAANKGCDAVEFDNMDIQDVNKKKYESYKSKTKGNKTGRPSAANQAAYVLWLSEVVHSYGMDVVLKNSTSILGYELQAKGRAKQDLTGFVNTRYIVVEECLYWKNCDRYQKIAKKNGIKVLAVEYTDLLKRRGIYTKKEACRRLNKKSTFHALIKDDRGLIPDGWDYYACRR